MGGRRRYRSGPFLFLRVSLGHRRRRRDGDEREPEGAGRSRRPVASRCRRVRHWRGAGGDLGSRGAARCGQSRADGDGRHRHGDGRASRRPAARCRGAGRDALFHRRRRAAGNPFRRGTARRACTRRRRSRRSRAHRRRRASARPPSGAALRRRADEFGSFAPMARLQRRTSRRDRPLFAGDRLGWAGFSRLCGAAQSARRPVPVARGDGGAPPLRRRQCGLNWVLIYGHLGAPALGVAGSGYASATNQWLILAGVGLCARTMPGLAGLRVLRRAFALSWAPMASILRLGLPIGGIMGIEVGVFLAAGILIGLLGTAALGAHQLVLNCAGISFMVPLGLSPAATVRVAYELGAGRALAARRAGWVALALGIGFMSGTAVVLWTVPEAIITVYIDIADTANRATVEIAPRLLLIAALFHVFDGMHTIAARALRA